MKGVVYSNGEPAFETRLLRALNDLAATIDDERMREKLALRGRRIVANCATRLDPGDVKRLKDRQAPLEARAAAVAARGVSA